jgi:hypothetical protein
VTNGTEEKQTGENRLKEGRQTVRERGRLIISSQINKEHKYKKTISKETKYVLLQSVRNLLKLCHFFQAILER